MGRAFEGSCHCGNIRTIFHWPEETESIPVRACGCSLCTKHGGVWTSNPNGHFELAINNTAQVENYRFGTKTADFHVCKCCGVIPIVTCEMEGRRYAVLNIKTFDDEDPAAFDSSPTDFEGESVDDRLARRRRNWTPEKI